jgi:hypothetical protein
MWCDCGCDRVSTELRWRYFGIDGLHTGVGLFSLTWQIVIVCLLMWFVGYDSLLLYINACVTIDRRGGIYDSESRYIKSNRESLSTANPT